MSHPLKISITVITTLESPMKTNQPKNNIGFRLDHSYHLFPLSLTQIMVGIRKDIWTAISPPKIDITYLIFGKTIAITIVTNRITAVNM